MNITAAAIHPYRLPAIVAGIMHYYGGPCGSYTGPYPATAKGGECVYQPISN